METKENLWAIVLAAGEGTRLRSLTTNGEGLSVPKQFCSFRGRLSMLQEALRRAERVVPRSRIVPVVSPRHRVWWEPELRGLPSENIVVQPANRGTAAGILLPLIEILRRDSQAQVLVLPSDHYVEEEEILQKAVEQAVEAAHWRYHRVVLLGMPPDSPDSEYGWILPSIAREGSVHPVGSFVEKPDSKIAGRLIGRGALWNSFMMVGPESMLLRLFLENAPHLTRPFLKRLGDPDERWVPESLAALYEGLPTLDFSRDLLERAVRHLAVLAVPPCGWSDLGTPDRVFRCLHREGEESRGTEILRFPEDPLKPKAQTNLNPQSIQGGVLCH